MQSKATTSLAGMTLVGVLLFPSATNAVSTAATPSDFNGDGYADLAVGVPGETIGTQRQAGGVNVLYGSVAGLTATGDQFWSQDSPGVKGTSVGTGVHRNGDHFGAALASGDFDGDGFADLAIGAPGESGFNVLYGTAAGLTADGDQLMTLAALSLPAGFVALGAVLASGDFDGDGYSDLATFVAVGGDAEDAGRVVILRGGVGGLAHDGVVVLDRSMTGATTAIEPAHWFGSSLAAGDLDGDGADDLAVGMYLDDDHFGLADVGVFYGGSGGLSSDRGQSWSQADIGIDGRGAYDEFGAALAIGDFDADGFGDLAIGEPMGRYDLVSDASGAVAVIYGSMTGLTADGNQQWDEDVPGIPTASHGDERFGYALAGGDLDGDGADDLAIGVPGEGSSGAVIALYGGATGLTPTSSQIWSQASASVPGSREKGDGFGAALASADYGKSGEADLAIGVPGEDLGGFTDAGVVDLLYGRSTGLSGTSSQPWSQKTQGIKESAGSRDVFGASLTP